MYGTAAGPCRCWPIFSVCLISVTSYGPRRDRDGGAQGRALGYAVRHPEGMILFDTSMGAYPEVDAHYRPRRVGLRQALAAIGTQISDIRLAANCHLHFDHCGGNPLLGQIPVFVQDIELGTAL